MEIFDWQGIEIRQSDEVHKVGTDAVLLGGWIKQIISSADQVLDIGTGTGILALHAARIFSNARITAIDIDEQATVLANKNASQSGFGERIMVLQGNILQQNVLLRKAFDLVVSNPPFFQSEMRPAGSAKQQAKHLDMPVRHWVQAMCDCTSEDGHLCMIIPAEDALSWIAAANHLGWYVAHKANVFSFAYDAMPKRSMVHFTRTLQSPVFQRINIYAEEKRYSQEFLALTGLRPASEA
jgi:tRNA1Val (adenine37-N6)-methyltransferase